MTRREWGVVSAVFVVAAVACSVWIESRPQRSEALTVAHNATQRAESVLVRVDTLRLAAKAVSVEGRASVRTLRDTLHLTDTLEVLRYVARVETALVKDSAALAAAEDRIAAGNVVTASVRRELAIALRPHPAPRLSTTLAGYYEPLTATPAASVELRARVIGGWALVARADARAGSAPRVGLGVALTL